VTHILHFDQIINGDVAHFVSTDEGKTWALAAPVNYSDEHKAAIVRMIQQERYAQQGSFATTGEIVLDQRLGQTILSTDPDDMVDPTIPGPKI
jgi:hypothetical protein